MELCDDATEAPYIDFAVIRLSQYDFRCTIISALDVGIDGLVFKTAGAEINYFDTGFIHFFE
jgi:hypothetical protein